MNILHDAALECNPYLKINFDGGDLSSDSGLLLIKEFAEKIGLVKLIRRTFKTNDSALFRFHVDADNLFTDDFSAVSSKTKDVNANRLRLRALAYNLFN